MPTQSDVIQSAEDIKLDKVLLVPYQTHWPLLAQDAIAELRATLPAAAIIDIQHVGSTAIPGMLAKPIIDIQIAVKDLAYFKPIAIDILSQLDYAFWYSNPDPERLFFVKGMPPLGRQRTHHIHIVEPTSHHWRDKIFFRDYLINHPKQAQAYQALKQTLAKQLSKDREAYTQAKSEFVQQILQQRT